MNIPKLRLRPAPAAGLLLATFGLAAAAGEPLPAPAVARAVALAASAAATLAPPQARVQVLPGIPDARLNLAPCAQIDPYLTAGMPAWGRTRVGLRCSAGSAHWSVFLPVTVQVYAPALVAATALPAGARITAGQLELAEVDWAASASPPYTTAAALDGRTLARPVAAGQALTGTDLQPRRWFAAGEAVRVVAAGSGYSVAAEGVALTAGLEGQPVRVRMAGDRVLIGRPVADREVEIAP